MGSEWVQLRDIVSIKGGKRLPKGESLQVDPNSHPYIRVRDMGSKYIPREGLEFVPDTVFPKIKNYIVNENDVIISIVGTVGLVAVIDSFFDSASQTENCAKLSGLDALDAQYLYYCLVSPLGQREIAVQTVGAVQPKLPLYGIENITIPWPLRSIRESIVGCLGGLDNKIVLNRQINTTLESMAQALFKSWFVDFDPVIDNALAAGNEIPDELAARAARREALRQQTNKTTNKTTEATDAVSVEQALPETGLSDQRLPSEIQQLFPDRFVLTEEMGWVPEGWEVGSVGAGFDVTMGQSPPGDTYNEDGIGMPFFQGRADFGFRYPTNRVYCTSPKRFAKPADTLVSVRAPVGDINMASVDCCIGRGVAAVRHSSGASSYTYYAMLQLREHFKVYEGEGTVFGSINQKDFKALPSLKVPESLLEYFEMYASKLDRKIELSTENINSLVQLRDSLLPKLLSGQITLPDAEQQLAEVL